MPVFNSDSQQSPFLFPNSTRDLWNDTATGPKFELNFQDLGQVLVKCSRHSINLLSKSVALDFDSTASGTIFIAGYFCGSAKVESNAEGIELMFDRFDPGVNNGDQTLPSTNIPGCKVAPIYVIRLAEKDLDSLMPGIQNHSANILTYMRIQQSMQTGIDASELSLVQFYIVLNESEELQLFCVGSIPSGTFSCTPVKPVPIIPTALVKSLSDGLVPSKTEALMGFLTMDKTRKLLLILESDPKVNQMPIIGVWIKGLMDINHPLAWQAFASFSLSKKIKKRVYTQSGHFLALMLSSHNKKPSFYKCKLLPTDSESLFSLFASSSYSMPVTGQSTFLSLHIETLRNKNSNELSNVYCDTICQYAFPNLQQQSGQNFSQTNSEINMCSTTPKLPKVFSEAGDYLSFSGSMPCVVPSVPEPSLLFEESQRMEPTPVRGVSLSQVGSNDLMQTMHDASYPNTPSMENLINTPDIFTRKQQPSKITTLHGQLHNSIQASLSSKETLTDHLSSSHATDHLLQNAYQVIDKQEKEIQLLKEQLSHFVEIQSKMEGKETIDIACQTENESADVFVQTEEEQAYKLHTVVCDSFERTQNSVADKKETSERSLSIRDRGGDTTEQSLQIDSSAIPEPSNEQSLASSLIAVDMPLLEDSAEDRSQASKDWYPDSPMFGESASTYMAPQVKGRCQSSNDDGFVGALVEQVHQILCNVSQNEIASPEVRHEDIDQTSSVPPIAYLPEIHQTRLVRSINLADFVKSRSCTELSMHANAIAQKYLSDEQLRGIIPKDPLVDLGITQASNLNTDGSLLMPSSLSPCNMSLATKKYLEKYNLLNISNMSVATSSRPTTAAREPQEKSTPKVPLALTSDQCKGNAQSITSSAKQDVKAKQPDPKPQKEKADSSHDLTWSQLKRQLGDSQHMLGPFLEGLPVPSAEQDTSVSTASLPANSPAPRTGERYESKEVEKETIGDTIEQILLPGILEPLNHEAQRVKKYSSSRSGKTASRERENISVRSVPTANLNASNRDRSISVDRILSSQVLDLLAERQTRRMSSSPRLARRNGAATMR